MGVLTVVELDEGHLGVGIDVGLLVYPADALESSHVVRVLGAQIAGMQALNLSVGFFLVFGFFQGAELLHSQYQVFLGHFRFQRLEPLLEGL